MHLVQDPSKNNPDNLNNIRHDVNRYFRENKKAYLRDRIEKLETSSKIQNIRDLYRGINGFNPSTWGHLNPSSYCDVGRLFYGVFKL